MRAAKQSLEQIAQEATEAKANALKADQAVTRLMGELQKVDANKRNDRDQLAAIAKKMRQLKTERQRHEKSLEQKNKRIASAEESVSELEDKIKSSNEEVGTELLVCLSDSEKDEMKNLQKQVKQLQKDERKQTKVADQLGAKKSNLESDLNNNLRKQLEEKQAELGTAAGGDGAGKDAADVDERTEKLEQKKRELEQAQKAVEDNSTTIEELQTKVDSHSRDMREAKKDLDQFKVRDQDHAESLAEASKSMEKLLNKRSLASTKEKDNMRKIRDLGTVPHAELDNFKLLSSKQLMQKLSKCNEQLKKYAHVNKKALDQYVNFSEQRETLISRKSELDTGAHSIQDLVDVLDLRKDEAILRTFKGVSQHFKQVFKELVPHGMGKLQMKISDEAKEEAKDEAKEDKESKGGKGGKGVKHRVSSFEAIEIKVSFTGINAATLIQQLSGGQKALVALALIFSIQRADPAPFYLFDEIDQALDSSHRAAVAALISRQAHDSKEPMQFITSTFRPEMVNVADAHYGIGHQNKVSNIHQMGKEETLDFIADIMNEEEAVGEPSSPMVKGKENANRSSKKTQSGKKGKASARKGSSSSKRQRREVPAE